MKKVATDVFGIPTITDFWDWAKGVFLYLQWSKVAKAFH